ncbi:Beta-glucosidase 18 [Glycine soja]
MSAITNHWNKMKMLQRQLRAVLILFCCVQFHVQSCDEIEDVISRSQFPEGFLFGTGTSSYQAIEGAYFEDGKGLSNWDAFSHTPGKIKKDENGDIADDHYHRYLEDIELMSSLGVNVYRFSISWARILPRGIYGDINPSGIMFYNKIIDNLLLRGIEPFVTIHHYDLPQELEERYGGWISPLIQSDFVHFAEICFKSFGDRVKYWTTINEPNLFADFGYMEGTYAPGHCSPPFGNCNTGNSDVEPLIVMHNMLLSHAKAVELYRKHFQAKQGGTIGIVAFSFMYDPLRDEECDRQAVSRGLAFDIACTRSLVLDPLVFGEYPPEMRSILGSKMPVFSPVEKSLLKGSLDFIGINHYGTLYAKDCSLSTCSLGADHPIAGFLERTATRDGIPIGDPTGVPDFFVVPRGMEKLVEYIKIRYRNMPMYITENGYSQPPKPDVTIHDLLQDFKRIDYHKAYLAALLRSIRKGADVRGYMIWSLLDNFEWTSGYDIRFGLYYVDRGTLERIPKLSVQWFSSFLNNSSHPNITEHLSKQHIESKDVRNVGRQLSTVMILLWCLHFHVQSCLGFEGGITRCQFPEGFLFGTSTSSYQIEGAPFEDEKGFSNWDVFSNTPGGIYGDINPNGIMFYNKIIDNLLLKGIEPFVTIHHQDLPQELEERYGGWISPLMQRDFVHLAEISFKSFGDRVKYWTTINEPALAKQGGTIGIVSHSLMYEPLREEECDRQAANSMLKKESSDLTSLKDSSSERVLPLTKYLFTFPFSAFKYVQIEGAPFEDGSGTSNWDVFSHTPGKINNDENGDIADDHYHRYLEDIELMSSLGVNVYRFSISWTRILPRGIYGNINPSGIMFYNKIIDNLLLRGIEPFVTIHHHDMPQELEEIYGGWISPLIQRDFVHFAEICFKSFGDRVKYWTTINEPNQFSDFAYMRGIYPPGRCSPPFGNCKTGNSDVEPLIALHNMLLSHAKAVDLYRKHFQAKQGGTIGIVADSLMFEPLRDEECDRQAASRALTFELARVLDPQVFGEYPAEMRSILGSKLPVFSPKEKSLIKGSLDFIGINHYGTLYAKDCTLSTCSLGADHPIRGFVETTATRNGVPIGEPTGIAQFFVVPRGVEKLADYIKMRYHNIPMYITENGYSPPPKPDVTIHDSLQDFKRIDYHKAYLAALLRSIRKGADVRGYMIWSLMDNFEWASGYDIRFGLYYVDRQTLERIPKLSVQWFSSFLNNTSHTNKQDLSEQYVRSKDVMTAGFEEGYMGTYIQAGLCSTTRS